MTDGQMVTELAQEVKMPAAKPENLRLILEAHVVEGENQSPKVVKDPRKKNF